ncbi:MAG: hypothetical protein QW472_04125, partial [Candidatus Aenigmatarchaeota archaeon]
TIRGNVTDECGLAISDASAIFRIFHTGYNAFSTICEPSFAEGNGYYNCTWNISTNPSGWYNVEMNSSRAYYNNGTKIRNQVFFHQVNPVLTSEFVSPQQAPWGSTFVFKVNVTDDDDVVNVSLWIRKMPTGEFYLANSTLCSDCVNKQVELSKRYTAGTDIGEYEWFINASDLHSGYAETSIKTFNVTKRNTYWIYSQGNNSWVSRIGSNTTILEARLFDAFTNSYLDKGSETLYINVTKDGTWGQWSNSSSLGYLTIAFDPDCSYSVGEQKWKAVFAGDAYYHGSESENFTVNIYSEFYGEVIQPNGEVYAEGENVSIVGKLRDECLNNVAGATTIFRIYPGGYSCTPEPANDLGNGNYNCTFGTIGLLGWYDISMNSSKSFFNDTYTLKQNAFQVRRKPSITSYQISPQQEGWGYDFTVNAYLLDADVGDSLNISLWKSYDGVNWIYVSSQIKPDCTSGCNIEFKPQFSCSDYLLGPTIYLKLNVSDSYGLKNETSVFTVSLEKDDVSFTTIQAPSFVDREGGIGTFVVRVKDVDKNSWLDDSQENVKGYFWFTREPSTPTWDSGLLTTVNSSGYMEVNFDPNCSYAASYQYWKVGILDNNCYADTNSTESGFTIKGQLKTNLYLPEKFSQFNVSDLINIRWNVYSDCYGVSGAYDSGNITQVNNVLNLYNFGNSSSCTDINEISEGNYNCTWDSTSQPEGNWTISIQTSKTNYNSNSTNYTDWFWLENLAPEIVEIKVSPEQGGWGSVFNYSVYVSDEENDEVSCLLYVNTTGDFVFKGLNKTSTPGLCNVIVNDFTCQDQSNASFYFIINDTFNRVNTSEIFGVTQGPNIIKNSVSITLIQGNGAKVNRSDSNPIGNKTKLILKVNDTTRNSVPLENTNGSIWITYDSSNFYSYFLQTNSSGYFNFDFDPDCEYQVGKQYWIAAVINDACYETKYTNSTPSENYTVDVIGDLTLEIISPKGEKYLRSNYPDGQNVNLTARITSDCSAEGGLSDAQTNFILTQGSTVKTCSPIESLGEGYYNCTLNTSDFSAKGWNVTFNASRQFFNSKSITDVFQIWQKGFWVETKPVLTTDFSYVSYNSTGHVGDGGWGELWVFWVNASDEDEDTLKVSMYVNNSNNQWVQPVSGEGNMTNSTVKGVNVTVTFMFRLTSPAALGGSSPIGPHAFKFNVSEVKDIFGNTSKDFPQNVYETENGTFVYQKDDIIFEHILGDNTVVNRTGTQIQPLTVRVYDTDLGAYPSFTSSGARIWVTNDSGSNYVEISGTTSVLSSFINTTPTQFDPDCNFGIGPQKWKVGILSSNSHFKEKNSTEYSINITTVELSFNYIQPKNGKLFIKSPKPADYLMLVGNVTDECGGVKEAEPKFYLYRGSIVKDCSSLGTITDYGNGTYSCLIANSTLHDDPDLIYGYWNVSFNASKDYYNSSEQKFEEKAFYLASRPILTTDSGYVSTGNYTHGWGDLWFFKVDVEDEDYTGEEGSLVNVSFWVNLTGSWEYVGSQLCSPPCTGTDAIKFNTSFSCENIGTRFFKFNATDNFYRTDKRFKAESTTQEFSIDPDQAALNIEQGDESSVNRPGIETSVLKASIADWSKGGIIVTEQGINGRIYITKNRTTFDSYIPIATGADGLFSYDFDPDCSYYTGRQWWKVELTDSCYSFASTANATVYVYGQLYSNLEYPPSGWTNGTGTLIPITLDVKSDCSGYIDEETPSVPNSTEGISYPIRIRRPDDSTIDNCYPWQDWENGTYNCTYNTTFKPPGYYDIILSSAKQYFIPNTTYYHDWFNLTNLPPSYQQPQVSPSSGGWGAKYNFSIQVKDTDLDSVNCSLYISTDYGATWRFVNSTIIPSSSEWQTCSFNFVQPYMCNSTYDVGDDNYFRFNLTDDVGQTTVVTVQGPIITKDKISINYVFGNNTNITRAFGILPLKVYVLDLDRNQPVGSNLSAQARISFNVTTDGTNYKFVGSNQTYPNLPGNASYAFDPDCSFDVGYQKWIAFYNSTVGTGECYEYNQSEEFTIGIIGQLVNYVVSPNSTKNRFVREEENITWRGNVTTDCAAKDGGISNANVT